MIEKKDTISQLVGFYRGVVVKHCANGRCKVWIPGVHPQEYSGTPDKLPDAQQAVPLFAVSESADGGDGNGVYSYPEIGTIVWCFFENNDVNYPVYFASTREFGSAEATFSQIVDSNSKIIRVDNVEIAINGSRDKISISVYPDGSRADSEKNASELVNELLATTTGNPIPNAVIKIDNSGKIELRGTSIDIKADDSVNIESNFVNIHARKKAIFSANGENLIYSSRVGIKSFGGGIDLKGDVDEHVVS